jgi:altronate hydrolase
LCDGGAVLKLGLPIGVAAWPIAACSHVHTHNLIFHPVTGTYRQSGPPPVLPAATAATFGSYQREDSRTGARNLLLVLATEGCSTTSRRYLLRSGLIY